MRGVSTGLLLGMSMLLASVAAPADAHHAAPPGTSVPTEIGRHGEEHRHLLTDEDDRPSRHRAADRDRPSRCRQSGMGSILGAIAGGLLGGSSGSRHDSRTADAPAGDADRDCP